MRLTRFLTFAAISAAALVGCGKAPKPVAITGITENEVAREYIQTVSYPDGNYEETSIPGFDTLKTAFRKDQPSPLEISWENDGTFGSTGWRMDYLFYSSDNSPENELFTLPQNTWEKMLSGPFYLLASIDDSNYYMQIMSGWWTSQWPDSSGLKAGDNHITDNGDGTITVEISFIGTPIMNELDLKGLLFTGDGYTPLKLFFQ